jgi:hypothetical protein
MKKAFFFFSAEALVFELVLFDFPAPQTEFPGCRGKIYYRCTQIRQMTNRTRLTSNSQYTKTIDLDSLRRCTLGFNQDTI